MCDRNIVVALKPIYKEVCELLEEIKDNPDMPLAMRNVEMQITLWSVKSALEEYSEMVTRAACTPTGREENFNGIYS